MHIEKLRTLPIENVAEKLGLTVNKHKCCCPFHDDHHPSLSFNRKTNKAHCFVCNQTWDGIALVRRLKDVSFADACNWLAQEYDVDISQHKNRQPLIKSITSKLLNTNNMEYLDTALLERFKGTSNEFTHALVQTGILTQEQMRHAAEAYHISTAEDKVIFWQIDQENNIREGKVMSYQVDAHRSRLENPFTISWLLKKDHSLKQDWKARNCFFGQHLLNGSSSRKVAVVESEKTAIICSELLSSECFVWLATGGLSCLSVSMLEMLKGRDVIIFPDTDSSGSAYSSWLQIAQDASKKFGFPIPVSDILEKYATEDQKTRKIDIADFILENK